MNTKITPGRVAFAIIAVLAATLFVRLGFWQLARHVEKRVAVDRREARLGDPAIASVEALLSLAAADSPGEPAEWRRVRLTGRWDFEHEVLIRNRAQGGRPGVHVVTPLRIAVAPAESTAVLVLRGWLPAPDALTPGAIAASGASGAEAVAVTGVLRPSRAGLGEPMIPSGEGGERRPSFAAVDVAAIGAAAGRADYVPVFVQRLPEADAPTRAPGEPVPVPLPESGTGPHMAYAIQWFAFALIALVGTGAFLLQDPRRPRPIATSASPDPG